jgi:hypothetical protein
MPTVDAAATIATTNPVAFNALCMAPPRMARWMDEEAQQ